MSKMIIMKGLPASGKSTKAEALMITHGNAVRINKDLLRTMLHFDKFTGKNEGLTREAARALATHFLKEADRTVIIDDTNLNEGTMQSWKDLAKELKCRVEIADLTDVPIEECVLRDTQRAKSVGGTVIKNMALRAGIKKFSKDSLVLCDIDGTISDTAHRLHFVNKMPKDWNGFFGAMADDPVRDDVRKKLIEHYNEGRTIIFLSARPEKYRDVTLKWLHDNMLTFAWTLVMRPSGDGRPDTETKRDMFEKHFKDKDAVHAIYDDRPSVIRLWKELGLNVIDVGKGEEF
jgi:predicted kinase